MTVKRNSDEVGEDILCFTQSRMICARTKEGKEFCVLMDQNNVFKAVCEAEALCIYCACFTYCVIKQEKQY